VSVKRERRTPHDTNTTHRAQNDWSDWNKTHYSTN